MNPLTANRLQISPMNGSVMSWEDDFRTRMNPRLVTSLLHEAVPVTRHIDLTITKTAEGYAESRLPLNEASTNQHGTHQAALVVLAADYTGGTALATLLRGIPVLGVHPQPDDNGASIWLVRVHIDYKAPSASDLTVSAEVSPEAAARVRERYARGVQVMEEVTLSFVADGQIIATACLTYMLRQARMLKPQSASARPNTLFRHRVTASARLIAGVRAAASTSGLTESDRFSAVAAGAHGRLLASRFTRILPQLPAMVAARTRHIDAELTAAVARGTRQVVLIGAGLDFRCHRLVETGALPSANLRVFELDFPHVLDERDRVLAQVPAPGPVSRVPIGVNIERENVSDVLVASGYDIDAPAFFVFEGVSMYLDRDANTRVANSIAQVLRHADSLLWVDVVAESVIARTTGAPEAEAFMAGMERLGEPFVFGLDDPDRFFARLGLELERQIASHAGEPAPRNAIYDLYHFCVFRSASPSSAALSVADYTPRRFG